MKENLQKAIRECVDIALKEAEGLDTCEVKFVLTAEFVIKKPQKESTPD